MRIRVWPTGSTRRATESSRSPTAISSPLSPSTTCLGRPAGSFPLPTSTANCTRRRPASRPSRGSTLATAAAVDAVASFVADDAIDCGFERAPACTYTTAADQIGAVEAEHEAAVAAGLSTRLDATTELPFEVAAAVWLDDQAQFHPRRY